MVDIDDSFTNFESQNKKPEFENPGLLWEFNYCFWLEWKRKRYPVPPIASVPIVPIVAVVVVIAVGIRDHP